jgi:hypothetical protein
MFIIFLWGNRTMAQMNSNLQLMFGNSGPEGPDHDGENGHEKNDDQTGVETFIVLCQCHKTFFGVIYPPIVKIIGSMATALYQ